MSRPTIYSTLQHWTEEGVAGLEEKSRARKGPRQVTLKITNEVRKLQENPLLGKWRMSAALARMGIEVSPTTCGRIMEANRQLYGLEKLQRAPREKLEMPFKAVRRHQFWSADIRYIEEHLLPDPKPVYIITVFENFSRCVLASVWVYEGNLKVEYQATALSLFELSIEKGTGKIAEVTNARRLETHFRNPQLDLWQLSDTEWLLALRRPEPSVRKKVSKITAFAQQLRLLLFGTTG